MHLINSLLSETERKGHSRTAYCRDDPDVGRRVEAKIRFFRMLGVDTVPSFRDADIRSAEKAGDVPQDEIVHFFFIEHIHTCPILVGIAKCEFAFRSLRHQTMNVPTVVLRGLGSNATPKHG